MSRSVSAVGPLTAMLMYTAAELIGLCHSRLPPQPARKALFKVGLWLPRDCRLRLPVDQLIGVYQQRHMLRSMAQQCRTYRDLVARIPGLQYHDAMPTDYSEVMSIPTVVGHRPPRRD